MQLVGVKVRCNGDHTPSVGCELSVHCVGMCTTRATAAYVDLRAVPDRRPSIDNVVKVTVNIW